MTPQALHVPRHLIPFSLGVIQDPLVRYYFGPHGVDTDLSEPLNWVHVKSLHQWRVMERARRRAEKAVISQWTRLGQSIANEAAKAFKARITIPATDRAISEASPKIEALLLSTYRQTASVVYPITPQLIRLAKRVRRKMEEDEGRGFLEDPDAIDEATPINQLPEYRAWMARTAASRVVQISDATKRKIAAIIRSSVAAGDTLDEVRVKIQQLGFPKVRAERIARTEVVGSANATHFYTVNRFYDTNNATKDWIATGDKRTRPTHVVAGRTQKRIPFQEPFTVGGQKGMFPGDPSLGAREVIQCVPGDQVVSIPLPALAMRSWYDGELVTLQLADETQFSVTVNHPVLTQRGFVPAKDLDPITDSICMDGLKLPPADANVEYRVSPAQKVYDSLADTGMTMRQVGGVMNFHQQRGHQNIDVVFPYGQAETVPARILQQRIFGYSPESCILPEEDGHATRVEYPLHPQFQRLLYKSVTQFSGHVYNFNTPTGTYSVGSALTQNCRCSLTVDIPL